jgi:hypothetical protein
MSNFQDGLQHLIKRYSIESGSNTPDFLLAEYMSHCLTVYESIVNARDEWYGFEPNKALFTSVEDSEVSDD